MLDDGRSQRELVVRERMTVGRDPGCDISDGDPRLSRRHAEFLATAGGLVVRDLESRNGVRVNGRTGPGSDAEHRAIWWRSPIWRCASSTTARKNRRAWPCRRPTRCLLRASRCARGLRTIALACCPCRSCRPSSRVHVVDRETLVAVRDAGDAAISALEGTVRVALPRNVAQTRSVLPRPRLGVQDLMTTGWGWRVLGQGVLLAGVVFLMVTIPMLHWLTSVSGPIGNMLLLRMLTAPLLASLFLGLIVASLIARTTARGLERDDHT